MKLVIVADDARVIVDAVCYDDLDISQLDATIHAVQWNGVYGEIEYKPVFVNGAITKASNQIITSIDSYQWAIDAWNVANDVAVAAIAAAIAEAFIPVVVPE
jgi:CO dehydrogenase/acetyl-CoA synthase epsilon subunit